MHIYKTNRLDLRRLSVADSSLLLDYRLRTRTFLQEWEPLRNDAFYTEEAARMLIEDEEKSFATETGLSLYIFNKGEEKIIGCATLSNIVRGVFQSCFLGYKLDEEEINQGKMTEALQKVIEIAFDEMQLHRIEASILPRNIRSKKVVEKLGFTQEGLSKAYLKIQGKWEDHVHYALLNEKVN
ncbi:GNAT family N-acetyltransferase [uncultured Sphaerochaeta sp.]|uniref:GNAT family N-acetyltransferase n=1 Tax=uncultured Sphaerochaeta sp. TaxID=886478 RepID=UPI002A0A2497|nr:GNAT family N-acetyltransferase [uncultured Sphaerochaeta sp.]